MYVSADYDDNNERSRACLVESYCIKIQDVVTFFNDVYESVVSIVAIESDIARSVSGTCLNESSMFINASCNMLHFEVYWLINVNVRYIYYYFIIIRKD